MKKFIFTLSLLIAFSISSCKEQVKEVVVEKPANTISPEKAKEMNQRFVNTRSKAMDSIISKLDNVKGKKDNISSWFSIEELEQYIAYAKAEGIKNGYQVNGMRIYFGAYSKNPQQPGRKNYSTVFIVPTKRKGHVPTGNSFAPMSEPSEDSSTDPLNYGGPGEPPDGTYPQ